MSIPTHLLTRALGDRFQKVANPFYHAGEMADTLRNLIRSSNRVFAKSDMTLGGAGHYIMDFDELASGDALRPRGDRAQVYLLGLFDSCKSKDRKFFAPVPEGSVIIRYNSDGLVECRTVKKALTIHDKPGKTLRQENFRSHDISGIEGFIATWLRKNFDAKIMVAIAADIDEQCEKDCDSFEYWNNDQRDRLSVISLASLKLK